jgi:hypothetical protein
MLKLSIQNNILHSQKWEYLINTIETSIKYKNILEKENHKHQ